MLIQLFKLQLMFSNSTPQLFGAVLLALLHLSLKLQNNFLCLFCFSTSFLQKAITTFCNGWKRTCFKFAISVLSRSFSSLRVRFRSTSSIVVCSTACLFLIIAKRCVFSFSWLKKTSGYSYLLSFLPLLL